jgi:uncharacterized membrane protein
MDQAEVFSEGSLRTSAAARWTPVVAGSALAIFGLTRPRRYGIPLAAAGGALAYSGIAATRQKNFETSSSILVNASREELYRFWRDFENLPRFMRHLENVSVNGRHSRWTAVGPLGQRLRWVAELVDERENELISWRTLPGSDINVTGSVQFRPATGGRGTVIFANIHYRPPAGAIGRAFAKIMGKDPGFLMRQDLRRFKALIEAGEIPTTEGQSHGPRSAAAAIARLADPDQPMPRGNIGNVLTAKRRIS